MRRNAVLQNTTEGSFAGLLEHLAGHSRPEPVDRSAEADFPSRTGLDSASSKPSDFRSGSRSLPPVTEWRAGRDSTVADGMPLSYEQALRIHARRRTTPIADLDTRNAVLPELSKPEAAPPVRSRKMTTGKNQPSKPSETSMRSRTQTKSEPGTAAIPKPSVQTAGASPSNSLKTQVSTQTRLKSDRKSSSKSGLQTKASLTGTSPNRRRMDGSRQVASQAPSASTVQSPPEATSQRKTKSSTSARPASKTRREARQVIVAHEAPRSAMAKTTALTTTADQSRSLATIENADFQPDLQLDQRRATVSVRLTDVEFLRLKDRASESGISVSAYMRSCILDADQLRSQVKQALAQMRALSANPEPNRFPALTVPEQRSTTAGNQWVRIFFRSAAVFLSPLFAFRRSA